MPEGPEIRRAADRVERAVAGQVADRVEFHLPRLRRYAGKLRGHRVTHVETRGKAMLTHFDCGLSVYSHNQLYGRWYVQRAGTWPKTGRSLRFAVHGPTHSALLYSASEIDVLHSDCVDEHPFLAKLGPDLLSPAVDEKVLRAQIADPRFARRPLHALLLDQGFIAGIGNYLRSEILFQAKLHPLRRPGELAAAERRRLARAVLTIGHRAYETGGITNDPRRAKRLMAEGFRRGRARHHVFTRGDQACWTCGETVRREDWGQRKIFFCPQCQPSL